MKKPNYNIINIISLLTEKINFSLLIIFIILADCEDLPKIIKFKKDGNIKIYNAKNNDTIFTHLYSPLIYIKIDENNINFNDNNIFPVESGDFTYVIPGQDVSLVNISLEEFTLNSHLLLKKYPNLLFNTNKTFSLFSINIINGYLSKYENYKSTFLEENNFMFIKQICPNDKNEILFLRIDYFIKMRYTYQFKENIKNNDIIWYSHFIKIIPMYPEIILLNSDIYDIDRNYYEKDDFYIFQINENKTISILYSQDKDLYAEIKDIKNDFNFNNYYFGNKKRDKLFQDKILEKEENKKYLFVKFPKRFLIAFITLLLIIIFIKIKAKESRKKVKFEVNNENNEIKTNKINIDLKENNEINTNKKDKIPSPKAKSITNLNIYFGLENKNSNNNKNSQNMLKNLKKKTSYYKNSNSSKKRDLLSSKKMIIRKSITNYKKKKTITIEEKNILNQLFNTYLEDIKNNNNNNDSTVNLNLNIKTVSIADKYKKLYSLLDVENNSEKSTEDYKESKINREHQNLLKKEFQNNFNYFIDSGRLLKEFKDFQFIGKGGFGVVLKASNILDEGQWAIKIMRINLDLRKAKELNAIQEIKMMSKFKKKNIVRYKTCWFEFAQNDTIKKRERAASFDENYIDNKEDSKINEQKAQENKQVIFEKINIKINKRKNTVIYDRSKDNDIIHFEDEEEMGIEKKESKKIKQKEKNRIIKPEKRRTSNIWDDDEDYSDDSLGADKNYIIREEGKKINLDDRDSLNEDIVEEEEEDEESSSFEENKDIIKEEEKRHNNSSDNSSSGYNNLRYEKNTSNFRANESSSNLIDTNSNNSKSKNKNEDEIHNNKRNDSKFIIYFFIQMEYCSGCPMNYYLSHRKSVPSKSLTSYMFFQMCYAVKHIHEGNIIHRDLKPGNIFIMNDYLIKIGDFGLALNFGKTKNEQGGTYLYQSPEQIQNKTYDQKVDIFALGVILVELVSKFDTEYERVEVLQGLKNDLYPSYLEKDHLNEFNLIKKMTRLNSDERPNIQDIFSDPDFIALSNSH